MAHILIVSKDFRASAELTQDDETGDWKGICRTFSCPSGVDLLESERASLRSMADAVEVLSIHVDRHPA